MLFMKGSCASCDTRVRIQVDRQPLGILRKHLDRLLAFRCHAQALHLAIEQDGKDWPGNLFAYISPDPTPSAFTKGASAPRQSSVLA
jgi:hypothetical protein